MKAFVSLVVGVLKNQNGSNMNSDNTLPIATDEQDDMQPSYDFAKGVRGKHARLLQRGYRVIIHKQDGTTEEQDYRLPHSAVLLDPDVQKFFLTPNQSIVRCGG